VGGLSAGRSVLHSRNRNNRPLLIHDSVTPWACHTNPSATDIQIPYNSRIRDQIVTLYFMTITHSHTQSHTHSQTPATTRRRVRGGPTAVLSAVCPLFFGLIDSLLSCMLYIFLRRAPPLGHPRGTTRNNTDDDEIMKMMATDDDDDGWHRRAGRTTTPQPASIHPMGCACRSNVDNEGFLYHDLSSQSNPKTPWRNTRLVGRLLFTLLSFVFSQIVGPTCHPPPLLQLVV
jgi:hypothetical protein